MTKIHYKIVQHDGGWAYKLGEESLRLAPGERDYEAPDMAHCPAYGAPICSVGTPPGTSTLPSTATRASRSRF